MARNSFEKPSSSKGKSISPTASSSLSSIANTSRDSSAEYETPGTTPATSIRGAASTAKRKRSSLGQHVLQIDDSDEDGDEALALRLQEEEYTRAGAEPAKKRAKWSIADSEEEESELSELESTTSLDSIPLKQSSKSAKAKGKGKAPAVAPSRGGKAKLSRTASAKARQSMGSRYKMEDSDFSGIDDSQDSDEDEFVAEAGVSDTESDVPLASIRPTTTTAPTTSTSLVRRGGGGRRILSNRRGRRHGNIGAEAAIGIGDNVDEIVRYSLMSRKEKERDKLEKAHPSIKTMWKELESTPVIKPVAAAQPDSINRKLKPFQLQGLDWMVKQEQTQYNGGLLGDEMGMGKTIQAVSLIMSDYPQKEPTLVVVPPVALLQWSSEITEYTDGKLNVLVYHGQNSKIKNMKVKDLKK